MDTAANTTAELVARSVAAQDRALARALAFIAQNEADGVCTEEQAATARDNAFARHAARVAHFERHSVPVVVTDEDRARRAAISAQIAASRNRRQTKKA